MKLQIHAICNKHVDHEDMFITAQKWKAKNLHFVPKGTPRDTNQALPII